MINSLRERVIEVTSGRFYYGWVIVAISAIGMFSSGPGQSHTFSVFLGPIGRELDISKASIATAYAIATLLAAFLLPRMGKLVDRFGPRRMLMIISFMLGVACMFFGATVNFIWLAFGFAFLRFTGQGATMMGTTNLVSQWFSKRRGFAMSLMALGFAGSMAIHPPLSWFLIEHFGWRTAWVVLGLLTWAVMLLPLWLLTFDRPESVGLAIDGDSNTEGDDETPTIEGLSLPEARSTLAFYILCGVWFIISGFVTVLHFYQVTVLTAQGLSVDKAASLFPISAVTMVITMPLAGRLVDAVRTRYVVAIALILTASAFFAVTFVEGVSSAVVYAVIFGMTNAFMMTMFGYLWPRYFGRAHLGSIQGVGQMLGVIGASVWPVVVGYAMDAYGDPSDVLRGLALIALGMAVFVVIRLRTPAGIIIPEGLE